MRAPTVVKAVLLAAVVACSTPDALQPTALLAQTANGKPAAKPTIVLVHGAFADASGWQTVILQLQQEGYKVVAVQNPLSSLPNDVETTKRLIDAQTGPVVVVAHSYGGAVISGAAAGNPNVKALVYIAALAPDANEVLGPLLNQYPTPVLAKFVPDAAGFLYIDYAAYPVFFAPDIPLKQAEAMAVAQKPLSGAAFTQTNPAAAWRTIPSWFMVAQDDSIINPNLERFFAKRMNAKITEIKSSHVIFLSHPQAVVRVIRQAAGEF
ncbi:MAG TPA: alpha/beta hydrolase [Gemmatimonadales bacterium]|jgi:pimeloyl-ACP methyl ester carboxylesterase